MAVCSQFQQAAAEEGGGSESGKRDPLRLSLHWWLSWTPSSLAHQPHRRAPRRLGENGDRAASRLPSVQRHQLPEGQHFQSSERVVHGRERAHKWKLHLHQPWVKHLSFQVWMTQTRHQPFTDFCLDGTPPGKVVGRASDAMWIFSTGLCAVVGVMVAVGVGYQIHLDRVSKRKKLEFQYQQSKRGRLPRSLTRKPPHICGCPKLRVHFDPCDNQKYPTWLFYFAVLWKWSFFCRNIHISLCKKYFFYWKTGIILIVCCHQVIKEGH